MITTTILLKPGSIWINDRPLILLSSSLFYFRIPASEWRSRMHTLRALGYNTIDVYFPWNYHEVEPNQWDFEGEHDVRAFLDQAKEEGLWVVARPGPYICSEWDGGSLPAYLTAKLEARLRDNSSKYLEAVRGWYDRIMPILAEYQLGRGGSVVLVQIENELDFYDCSDRNGMMVALRDMARVHGITVPLLACAGQGDILGATGGVSGVVPACNMYFDFRDPKVEMRARHYERLLRQQGLPLCIIETNRSHTDLRRLIAGGAKLIGPYLQTGGSDFGFTNGVTNWGNPLAFMTSYYDFGGMISPSGKVRPEGREAIILSKMLVALGTMLALSVPLQIPPVPLNGIDGHALALDGGGWLIGLPNTTEKPLQVTVGANPAQFPLRTELNILPNTCPFILMEFPLTSWGIMGKIRYSTTELVGCLADGKILELTFAADATAELMIDWEDSILGGYDGWQIEHAQEGWRLWVETAGCAMAELIGKSGKRLVIRASSRVEISDLQNAGLDDRLIVSAQTKCQEIDLSSVSWRLSPLAPCDSKWFGDARICKCDELFLEQNNIFRGYGWYRTSFVDLKDAQGLLVQSGSDVLSVYIGTHFIGTFVPGGGSVYKTIPVGIRASVGKDVVVRAEIWGHANFDDNRLPALRLKSLRGIGGLTAVRKIENITHEWFYQHNSRQPLPKIDLDWPYINFGGWSTTEEPLRGVYYHETSFVEEMDTRVLHFPGLQVSAQVFFNGRSAGCVNPFDPFVDLSDLARPGETGMIAIAMEQDFRRSAGQVVIYEGESFRDWELAGWCEDSLASSAQSNYLVGADTSLPINLTGGEMAWLHSDLPLSVDWERGWDLQFLGQGMKVAVWVGRRLVGRIWLPSEIRPAMVGGADDRIFLPAAWLREAGGRIHLMLESVDLAGELRSVKLILDTY